jgi:hypothetical protein
MALEESGRLVDDRAVSFAGGAIPIEFVLLRGSPLVGDVALKPGMVVNGRVLELFGNGRGFINLAGVKIEAQLPGTVRAGEILRMRVSESADERLSMKIVDQFMPGASPEATVAATEASAQQPLVGFGLPGGATARLLLDSDGGDDHDTGSPGGVRSIILRYDSELLGRMDVVVRLDDAQVKATVIAMPGAPLESARRGADELRGKLREAADRPAQVLISGRALEVIDVQA